jgi:hypothetical protein
VSKSTIFSLAASLILLYSVTSCKKTTNNTTVVKDSIYYSSWVALSMQFSTTDSVYYQDFNNSKITAAVIRSGAVLGYFGTISSTTKDTIAASSAEFDYLGITEQLAPGVLDLSSLYNLSYSNGGFLYRYVIIPGNVLANTSLKDVPVDQLKKMKFTDLQKVLNTAQSSTVGNTPTFGTN